MRVFYKNSLFLYEKQQPKGNSPIIIFWRATVFTFNKPASKRTLKRMIDENVKGELIEPATKQESYEVRQVAASESRGLGFYFVDIAKGEKSGWDLQPEDSVAVWHLSAYEKVDLRLGHSEFNRQISYYRAFKNVGERVGREPVSFWRWLAH